MLPLYAELIVDEIVNADVAAAMQFDGDGLAPKISMLPLQSLMISLMTVCQ